MSLSLSDCCSLCPRSAGMRCTPLTVEVHLRKAIEADIDDHGFQPKIIRIDEGNSVHWQWRDCSVPHQVRRAQAFALKS